MADADHLAPHVLVVMGVSGVGKTSVVRALVDRTGWPFREGDDLHPEANRKKMAAGHPLDDDDRWPWLRRVAEWIGAHEAGGGVITCSALKRSYRDLLRNGHRTVLFVHLVADEDVLTARVTGRHGHYMPPSLLRSQLDALEPLGPDEPGVHVEAHGDPEAVAARALEAIRHLGRAATAEAVEAVDS